MTSLQASLAELPLFRPRDRGSFTMCPHIVDFAPSQRVHSYALPLVPSHATLMYAGEPWWHPAFSRSAVANSWDSTSSAKPGPLCCAVGSPPVPTINRSDFHTYGAMLQQVTEQAFYSACLHTYGSHSPKGWERVSRTICLHTYGTPSYSWLLSACASVAVELHSDAGRLSVLPFSPGFVNSLKCAHLWVHSVFVTGFHTYGSSPSCSQGAGVASVVEPTRPVARGTKWLLRSPNTGTSLLRSHLFVPVVEGTGWTCGPKKGPEYRASTGQRDRAGHSNNCAWTCCLTTRQHLAIALHPAQAWGHSRPAQLQPHEGGEYGTGRRSSLPAELYHGQPERHTWTGDRFADGMLPQADGSNWWSIQGGARGTVNCLQFQAAAQRFNTVFRTAVAALGSQVNVEAAWMPMLGFAQLPQRQAYRIEEGRIPKAPSCSQADLRSASAPQSAYSVEPPKFSQATGGNAQDREGFEIYPPCLEGLPHVSVATNQTPESAPLTRHLTSPFQCELAHVRATDSLRGSFLQKGSRTWLDDSYTNPSAKRIWKAGDSENKIGSDDLAAVSAGFSCDPKVRHQPQSGQEPLHAPLALHGMPIQRWCTSGPPRTSSAAPECPALTGRLHARKTDRSPESRRHLKPSEVSAKLCHLGFGRVRTGAPCGLSMNRLLRLHTYGTRIPLGQDAKALLHTYGRPSQVVGARSALSLGFHTYGGPTPGAFTAWLVTPAMQGLYVTPRLLVRKAFIRQAYRSPDPAVPRPFTGSQRVQKMNREMQ